MRNCILAKYNVKAKQGDKIKFEMPGFCSGDYTFDVIEKNGLVVLEDSAPEKIFDGCYGYEIIER